MIDPNFSNYFAVSSQVICSPVAINTIPSFTPLNNNLAFKHLDCQENIGSFDPNDKHAVPIGYGPNHNILPNAPLEYKIRFQNTGTDTAFRVVIIDTLSSLLVPSSIRMGAASHNYTWQLYEQGIVKITFDNIYLPDSNVNEAGSHGFVKFWIEQSPNLLNGTLIENSAAIYFDFNEPVITNTAFHTICDNCMPLNIGGPITKQQILPPPNIQVHVMPNPLSEQTTIEVTGQKYENLYLKVYDILGQTVFETQSNNNTFHVQRGSMTKGMYLYSISTKEEVIYSNKLLVK